jgi:hypothetical protein
MRPAFVDPHAETETRRYAIAVWERLMAAYRAR